MIKIGITGQAGFIGTHLSNFLNLKKDEVRLVPFEDRFFTKQYDLEEFVKECDAIVHLAALNRHNDPQAIYETILAWLISLYQHWKTQAQSLIYSFLHRPRRRKTTSSGNPSVKGDN